MRGWKRWLTASLLGGTLLGMDCGLTLAQPLPVVELPPISSAAASAGSWRKVEPFSMLLRDKQAIDRVTSSNAIWRFGVHLHEPLVKDLLLDDYAGGKRHSCGGADRPSSYADPAAFQVALRQAFISNAEMTRLATQAQQLGASFVRVNLRWDAVECQTQGQYNFAPYQDLVEIFNRQGLAVQFILSYPNDYYPAPVSMKSLWAPFRDYQIAGFARFAAQAATQFKADLVSFEIWNEANTDTFWQDGARNEIERGKNFARFVNRTTQAIKAVNPRALVVSGGTFNVPNLFLQQVATDASSVDAVGIHLYARSHPESFDDEWQNITQARQHRKPIFMTESGISGTGFDAAGAFLDYQRDEVANRPVARDRQASWYTRLLLKLWTKGVDQIVLYELQDRAKTSSDDTARELNYGLYDRKGIKPAGRAVQQLRQFLARGDNRNALLYRGLVANRYLQVLALGGSNPKDQRMIVWLRRPATGFQLCLAKPNQPLVVKNMFGDQQLSAFAPCSYAGVPNAGVAVTIKDMHGLTYLEF